MFTKLTLVKFPSLLLVVMLWSGGLLLVQSTYAQTCSGSNIVVGAGQSCPTVTSITTGVDLTTVTASISAINNAGTIGSDIYGSNIRSSVSGAGANAQIISTALGAINNSGTISGSVVGLYFSATVGAPSAVNNNSTVSISNIINTGIISGGNYGLYAISSIGAPGGVNNRASLSIDSLTNFGSITGGSYDILYSNDSGLGGVASGVFTTFNNAQGGNASSASTTALIYRGVLPSNYNIIISSASHYGQLSGISVDGSTAFGIYAGSVITSKLYTGVLQGLTAGNVGATRTGTYSGLRWSLGLESGSSTIWDLTFTGGSTADTQSSLAASASALQGAYTLQNTVLVNGFTYDCPLFDKNGVCISAGGRNTTVSANSINNTSGLLIGAYRVNGNIRVGAYVDQNLSSNTVNSIAKLDNSTPALGLFGVWSEKIDGTGAEVKVSAGFGQKNTTVTRQVIGTSEAGSGSSNLMSRGAQAIGKYGFAVMDKTIVSPYAGIRYTQNNMGGYTEGTSSAVTAPLTYSALNTNATTALAGVGASYKVIPTVTTLASAGVETDLSTSNGSYSATGVTGLTPINFNPSPVRTRPTAMLGAYYDIEKNQRLGITGIYRQEAYQAVSTTTVMATYTVGL